MSKLSLEAIRIVQAIKVTGSFTTAAKLLYRTPSAISYRVASIEEKLGVKLFHRNGPVITLTKEGNMLLNGGEWIVNAVDCLEKRIQATKKGEEGHVRIGKTSYFPIEFLCESVTDYFDIKKNCRLELSTYTEGTEWGALEKGSVDLILTSEQKPVHIEASTMQLYNTSMVCCCGYNHIFNQTETRISDELLTADTLIILKDDLRGDGAHFSIHKSHQKTIIVPDLLSVINMLKRGLGHAYIPYISVASEIENGNLFLVDTHSPLTEKTFWIAWHSNVNFRCVEWWKNRIISYLSPHQTADYSTHSSVI